MWKNVLVFLNCKAVAKILPAMSGKAETLTLRPVIPKRLTGAIHEGSVLSDTSVILTDVENSNDICYDKSAVKAAKIIYFYIIYLRRVLFEKVQHIGDCGLTGRFADNHTSLPLKSSF